MDNVRIAGGYDEAYSFTTPSAPALAMKGSDGWNSTSRTPSRAFSRCVVISCTHARDPSRSQNRTEQSWLPDTSENPAASIDNDVTPSRCANIECVHCPKNGMNNEIINTLRDCLPVVMSKIRINLSSCAVTRRDMVGCETIRFICVAGVPSGYVIGSTISPGSHTHITHHNSYHSAILIVPSHSRCQRSLPQRSGRRQQLFSDRL